MMKLELLVEVRIRGGVVGRATTLWAGGSRVRIPGGSRDFSIQNFQTDSGDQILFIGYRGSFSGGKAAGE